MNFGLGADSWPRQCLLLLQQLLLWRRWLLLLLLLLLLGFAEGVRLRGELAAPHVVSFRAPGYAGFDPKSCPDDARLALDIDSLDNGRVEKDTEESG
ncbi:hypothetical protein T492DRAFT_897106 [Pavlovales sp. CCMP2436]|nr:hypothetical protein T492DRAFT_897106 [Pavlovales sp. CCMP2436]